MLVFERQLASPSYKPGDFDILCGRGRGCSLHSGNKKFLALIRSQIQRYTGAKKRVQKSTTVRSIVSYLTEQGYHFLRQDETTQRWYELTDIEAYHRTAHAIRDLIRKQKNKKSKNSQANRVVTNTATSLTVTDEGASRCTGLFEVGNQELFEVGNSNSEMKDASDSCSSNYGDGSASHSTQERINSSVAVMEGAGLNNKRASTNFDIFFRLDSGDFKQILEDLDTEKNASSPLEHS